MKRTIDSHNVALKLVKLVRDNKPSDLGRMLFDTALVRQGEDRRKVLTLKEENVLCEIKDKKYQ